MKNEIVVHATRGSQGWGLTLHGEQSVFAHVSTLDKARELTVAHLATGDAGTDRADRIGAILRSDVTILPSDEDDAERVLAVREGTVEAARAQEAAARGVRELVAALDRKQYKSADIAGLLCISRGRVSQLLAEARAGQ